MEGKNHSGKYPEIGEVGESGTLDVEIFYSKIEFLQFKREIKLFDTQGLYDKDHVKYNNK